MIESLDNNTQVPSPPCSVCYSFRRSSPNSPPGAWKESVGRYVPMQAGSQIFSQRPEAGALAPWTGFAVFCLYAALALAAGFILFDRRDT